MEQISLNIGTWKQTTEREKETRVLILSALFTDQLPASLTLSPHHDSIIWLKGIFNGIRHNHKSIIDCHQSEASYNQNDFVFRQ